MSMGLAGHIAGRHPLRSAERDMGPRHILSCDGLPVPKIYTSLLGSHLHSSSLMLGGLVGDPLEGADGIFWRWNGGLINFGFSEIY